MTDNINYKDDPVVKQHLEEFREGAKDAFLKTVSSKNPSNTYQTIIPKVYGYETWAQLENAVAKAIYENKENPHLAVATMIMMDKDTIGKYK